MTSSVSPTASRRFAELDGLRGIAFVVVMFGHYLTTIQTFFADLPAAPFEWDDGRFGVQLFFLISGYVILMTAERSKRPSDFAIARFARLYPTYWVMLLVTMGVITIFRPNPFEFTPLQVLANATMLQRFLRIRDIEPSYWTLAVELTFYVGILVLLVATKSRLTPQVVRTVSLAWCLVGTVVCLLLRGSADSTTSKIILNLTFAEYAGLFAAGMMFFLGRRAGRLEPWAFVFSAFAVLNAGILRGTHEAAAIFVVCAVFSFGVLMPRVGWLARGPLNFLGRISYSAYLIHQVAGFLVIVWLTPMIGRLPATLVTVALVLGASYLSYRFLEDGLARWARSRLLAWRDRRQPPVVVDGRL